MKSRTSLFRSLTWVSVSVVSLIFAYKLGKDHNQTDTLCTLAGSKEINFVLKEDQTILGVVDNVRAMCFYIGNETNDKDYE